MQNEDVQKRMTAAYKLLWEEATNREKFEHIRTLIKGINTSVDKHLETCSKTLSDYEKLQKGEVIELTAEHLLENTEQEKKRKKALLLFIKSWKDLRSEVERIKEELENNQTQDTNQSLDKNLTTGGKIIQHAKGPYGIITLIAFVGVSAYFFINSQKPNNTPSTGTSSYSKSLIKVIVVNGKQIPLDKVRIVTGAECDKDPHYHALNGQWGKALDETVVPDPGGCGYGKVKDVEVVEVE